MRDNSDNRASLDHRLELYKLFQNLDSHAVRFYCRGHANLLCIVPRFNISL